MPNYYKYNFTSPEQTYAIVKEELRKYFDTGDIDDTLFTIYTSKCLKKLGRGSYPINHVLLNIEDFQARLPDNFIGVREAWLCTSIDTSLQLPSAQYNQIVQTSTRIDNPDVFCDVCNECDNPDIIRAIYKTTSEVLFTVKRTYLLKPGNISVKDSCNMECANIGAPGPDSYDIRDNKFVVTFRSGNVYLVFYEREMTEDGYELIPDNERIKEYIESFLKYKMFEQLCNIVPDDKYRLYKDKKDDYKSEMYEKWVIAETETKKETVNDKYRAILRVKRRHNKYNIR